MIGGNAIARSPALKKPLAPLPGVWLDGGMLKRALQKFMARRTLGQRHLLLGGIVECSTTGDRLSAALMQIGGPRRMYYYLDPPGPLSASIDKTAKSTGVPGRNIEIVRFANFSPPPISILRIEHEPATPYLDKLWYYVLPGGLILMDGYDFRIKSWEPSNWVA